MMPFAKQMHTVTKALETPTQFRDWLKLFPISGVVGKQGQGLECPLANFLSAIGAGSVVVGYGEDNADGDGAIVVISGWNSIPLLKSEHAWVDYFVHSVDSIDPTLNTTNITVGQCLDILNAITPPDPIADELNALFVPQLLPQPQEVEA